jgi:transcriptional pleiotropic regulator of transition state genes
LTYKNREGGLEMGVTGIVRRVDPVGRVVIPMEIRRTLGISPGDPMEILVQGEEIVIKRFTEACFFCGSKKELKSFKGRKVCESCRKKLASI